MGSRRDCTWILGLVGFRVVTVESDGEVAEATANLLAFEGVELQLGLPNEAVLDG
jgi:hypothetical protein